VGERRGLPDSFLRGDGGTNTPGLREEGGEGGVQISFAKGRLSKEKNILKKKKGANHPHLDQHKRDVCFLRGRGKKKMSGAPKKN